MRPMRWTISVLAAGSVLASACGGPESPHVPDEATSEAPRAELVGQGETIAVSLCASCHAVGREGDSPHADAVPFRQISWMYPVEALAEPLSEGIIVGHPDMPEWQFEPQDIDALLAYIESIQAPQET